MPRAGKTRDYKRKNSGMLKVALLSGWHVHTGGYAKFIQEQPDAKLTVIWDDDEARGKEWAERLGIDYESDLSKMLAREDVDAVLCDAPTNDHCALLVQCAKAKKHIFTEKALAPTVQECEEIATAVRDAGVKFVISFPGLTSPAMQYAKQAIDEGRLGKVTYLRFRSAHGGASQGWLPDYWYDAAKTGGGAMMDLGCHPNYQASFLLGKPVRIASMFNTHCAPGGIEDNAVSVIEFENKAIAVVETGFVSPYSRSQTEIHGTEGTLLIQGSEVKLINAEGTLIPNLPEGKPMALRQWIDAILYGKEIAFGLEGAIALTQLLENEYKADKEQRIIAL